MRELRMRNLKFSLKMYMKKKQMVGKGYYTSWRHFLLRHRDPRHIGIVHPMELLSHSILPQCFFGKNVLLALNMFVLNSSISIKPVSFEQTLLKFGKLDILVNNAGLFKEKMWEAMVNINLVGT